MFEKVKAYIKGVYNRMLNRQDIKNAFGVDVALSDDMANAIASWVEAYKGTPRWLMRPGAKSLGLPLAIAKEMARLVTIEFSSMVDDPFIDAGYQPFLNKLRNNVQRGAAYGGMLFKPYMKDGQFVIDSVPQGWFVPTRYNSIGEMTGVIIPEYITIGNKVFTKLERHEFMNGTHRITNRAFVKAATTVASVLGHEVPLTNIPEWKDLESQTTLTGITRPLFSYFKMPGDNIVDETCPLGVSIYADALSLIADADRQYSRIDWEFEGKELAIDVDVTALREDANGIPVIPCGKERLFRTLDFGANGSDTYHVFDPEIRDASLYNGLNEILRRIEFSCCLAYGTLSDPANIERTATEIKAGKQRSYSMVKDMQKALQTALEGLLEAMNLWAAALKIQPYKQELNIAFNWDDSIVIDKDTELASMQADVAAGLLKPEIYLAKKYGVSEEEAAAMMPEKEDPIEKILETNNSEE